MLRWLQELARRAASPDGCITRIHSAAAVARTAMFERGEIAHHQELSIYATLRASEELLKETAPDGEVPEDVREWLRIERRAYLRTMEQLSEIAGEQIVRIVASSPYGSSNETHHG